MHNYDGDLEKLVRDIEKGALRIDSIVTVDEKVYDAKAYRIRKTTRYGRDAIRIDLRERS